MDNPFNISRPRQGMQTLVAQFSFLQIERTISEVKELKARNASESEVLQLIQRRHKDLDSRSQKKILQLCLGITPSDDFSEDDLVSVREVKATSLDVELKEPREEFQSGEIVFFRGLRWVIASRRGNSLSLKQF